MRTIICFSVLLVLSRGALASETQIQLRGIHDHVLFAIPEDWSSYGQSTSQSLTGISLTPKRPVTEGTRNYPTVSITVNVEPPGSCNTSDKLINSELTKFNQQRVSSSESIVIYGKKATIIHTRNDEAEYFHVCVTLNQDRIVSTLTVSSGSDPKLLQRFKRDFSRTLQHVKLVRQDQPGKT